MRKKFAAFVSVTVCMFPTSMPAQAAIVCTAAPEAIMKVVSPEYPANAEWDTIYGAGPTQERFIGGIMVNERVLAVGERFGNDPKDDSAEIISADIDIYGRALRETAQKIPGMRGLNNVRGLKDGFIAVARKRVGQQKPSAWIGFFNGDAKLMKSKDIAHNKFALEAQDIVPLKEGGYLMAATAEEHAGFHHTVIYKLDANGNTVRMRAFATGLDNKILSLTATEDGFYIGAGYMRGDDGRRNGWLVMFNKNAEIVWDRQYPRGRGSQINHAEIYKDSLVAAGETMPGGGGNRAGWLMMLNKNGGDVIWQRYYMGAIEYSARDIMIAENGLFTLLLDSNASEKEDQKEIIPSIRLLAMNARGEVQQSDEFLNGQGVHAYKMLSGPNENRIVIGSTEIMYQPKPPAPKVQLVDETAGPVISPVKSENKKAPEPAPVKAEARAEPSVPVRSMDGWVIAATPVPAYKDPCAPELPPAQQGY